jgi:tetratricopeptide (TPR) repeat protein
LLVSDHPTHLVSSAEQRGDSRSRDRSWLSAARAIAAALLLCLAAAAWVRIGGDWRSARPVRQHLSAGIEFANQGMGPQAETEWKEALRLDPGCADACRLLAEYYFSARAWRQALAALQRLQALAPKEEHLNCRMAACYLNLGDEVTAFRLSEAEIRRDPNCVPSLALSSVLLNDMGEKPRAVVYLRRLGRLQPDDPALQYMLAETLSDTFVYQEARPVLEHVIRLDPNHSDAYAQLGIGWLDDASAPDHLQRAQQALRKSLELNPMNADARLALGRLYLRQHQPHPAVPQLEEAVRLMPWSSGASMELAKAYDRDGQSAKAAAMRRRFLSVRQVSARMSALEKRTAVDPTVFDYPYELGTIALRRGDYRRAYVYLRKAQALRPRDPRVAASLAELSRMTAGPSRMAAVQERIAQGASDGKGGGPGYSVSRSAYPAKAGLPSSDTHYVHPLRGYPRATPGPSNTRH